MGTIVRRTEKPYSWETIEIGDEYGPVGANLSDFMVKSHAFAVDDYNPWYFQDQTPFGGRIGHPTLLIGDINRLFRLSYKLPEPFSAGLHAKCELELLRPVFVGQKVVLRAKNLDKFEKRGRKYRMFEGEALDSTGVPLVRTRMTATVGFKSADAVEEKRNGDTAATPRPQAITAEVPEGAPVVVRAGRYVPVGAVLPSLSKETSLEQSIIYSGFLFGWAEGGSKSMLCNLHTDPEEARRTGNPDAVVQGLISVAHISEMCADFFGPAWLTTGRISVSFVGRIIVRDTLTSTATVRRFVEEDGATRLELDVWSKTQRGQLVTVGRASAQIQ